MFAQILEIEIELGANALVHDFRDVDATGFGQALQPRGHVDAITVDVRALDDDVPEVHADPEPEAALGGQISLAPSHVL